MGLANPNMVASSHIRRYIRAIEEIEDGEEIEKYIELRNRWSRGLHVWIPSSLALSKLFIGYVCIIYC